MMMKCIFCFSAVAGIIFVVASIPSILYTVAVAFVSRIRLKLVDELRKQQNELANMSIWNTQLLAKSAAEDLICYCSQLSENMAF